MKRRLIEEAFPVGEVSAQSSREKSIRHGHISTLHVWWARRPLASSRATIYASLVSPPPGTRGSSKSNFVAELSKWENSLNDGLLERARKEIRRRNNGDVPPKVLDPFGGGGESRWRRCGWVAKHIRVT